ncbi:hypothetical protein [Lentzea terrae]|uniref:hypothetical protein n=1 Tax=Lentzea terrae TaxID=2200761 RepID=UPI0013009A83|nr:hypothetical protein [Lentzea terrae]
MLKHVGITSRSKDLLAEVVDVEHDAGREADSGRGGLVQNLSTIVESTTSPEVFEAISG